MTKKTIFIFISCLTIFLLLSQAAAAAVHIPRISEVELIPPECREGKGESCNLDSFLQMFVNFSQILLATLTIFTFLIFVWNGIGLITSMGNPERIQGAKSAILGAVFGMVIVLSSWALVNTVVCLLAGPSCEIFGESWWGVGYSDCKEQEPYASGDCLGAIYRLHCSDGPENAFGNNVANIQSALAGKGCPVGSVDGCFGPSTEQAVKLFQIANGLTTDDTGTLADGGETMAALFSDSSRGCSAAIEPAEDEEKCCVPYNSTISCFTGDCRETEGNTRDSYCFDLTTECDMGCCYAGSEPDAADCENMRRAGCTESGKSWHTKACWETIGCDMYE